MIVAERRAAVVGGGPAGLMAAEQLAQAGIKVHLFDGMPSVGRKFLLAGIGGMNITHAEPYENFVSRYRERVQQLRPMLDAFGPAALRQWIHELGIETFVGSSGRVFPKGMKAAPLLRAWLRRLRESGVTIHTRHRWLGWDESEKLLFETPGGRIVVPADITVLAPGGASWPKLGSDGAWSGILRERNIAIAALAPSNCGFEVAWSRPLVEKHAGAPVKNVRMSVPGAADSSRDGEFIITESGIEGGLVYAQAAAIRAMLDCDGGAIIELDLLPDTTAASIRQALSRPRGSRSFAEFLRRRTGLKGAKAALLREVAGKNLPADIDELVQLIKALPLKTERPRPLQEAISTAGGVDFAELDDSLMLKKMPGVFCAGEMLDWEAPTGGYLLTACFATGRWAGNGALAWNGNR